MGTPFIQPSFAAGEVAPGLYARVDLAKYHVGAKTLNNMFVHAYGGVSNRPGTMFVGEALGAGRLIPFVFSTTQAYALEFTEYKMRILIDGGFVVYPEDWTPGEGETTAAGDIVEIESPFKAADLWLLKFAQSADTMFFAHPDYAPYALTRTDHHLWSFDEVAFAPSISAPTGLSGSYNGTSPTRTVQYVVSAISEDGEESLPSDALNVTVASPWESGKTVSLSWSAVEGAASYVVYKNARGYFGFIGTAASTSFTDDYIIPDVNDGPKVERNPFSGAGDYPGTVGLYEQRLWYARTDNRPQTVWSSQTGNLYNFGVSRPLKDDDAITATFVSRQVNEIRHILPLQNLIVMASDSEWAVTSGTSEKGGLTPTSINLRTQGYRGSSDVPPLVIGNTVLYIQKAGCVVRELTYEFQNDAYTGPNLSVLAGHLFENMVITEWCYQQNPDSIIWAIRNDGVLLGLTYLREHEVWGWHQHETAGIFESVCSVPGVGTDDVYFIVRRNINGTDVRFVEMLGTRLIDGDITTAFFVDCGLSYYGDPANVLSGFDHIANCEVSVLADGNVVPGIVVDSEGTVTLPNNASVVHVGIPYTSTLETLDLDFDIGQGTMQGRRKKISKLTVRFQDTRAAWAGPDANSLTELKFRTSENYGDPISLITGDIPVLLTPKWNRNGRIMIRQTDPLPITVLAIIPEIEIGN